MAFNQSNLEYMVLGGMEHSRKRTIQNWLKYWGEKSCDPTFLALIILLLGGKEKLSQLNCIHDPYTPQINCSIFGPDFTQCTSLNNDTELFFVN